jgi:hypothetical protein
MVSFTHGSLRKNVEFIHNKMFISTDWQGGGRENGERKTKDIKLEICSRNKSKNLSYKLRTIVMCYILEICKVSIFLYSYHTCTHTQKSNM